MKKILFLFFAMMVAFNVTSCKEEEETKSDTIQARENKEAGEKYMKSKASESGVYADPSGLLYSIKTAGEGEKPAISDTVAITYVGKTIKGSTFISTSDTVAVVDLSDGFHVGVRHMRVGAEYTLYIPYYLMFGAAKVERTYNKKHVVILPYSALVYEMKLDAIIKAKKE